MDLKTRGIPPTDPEREAVDSQLGPAPERSLHDGRGGHHHRERRSLLLATLHAVNDRVGWISQSAIDYIAERLDVSPAEIYGVASFYALFPLTERPAHQVHVCVDLVCRSQGGIPESELPDGAHASPCLGMCERAPSAFVTTASATPSQAVAGSVSVELVQRWAAGETPGPEADPAAAVRQVGDPSLVLLRGAGRVDPLDLDAYIADRGFSALERARQLGPEATIAAVTASGLDRARRRRLPDRPQVGRRSHAAGHPALPRRQRRRVRARHLQGPRADRERSVRSDRVDVHHRPGDGLRTRLRLPPRRVPAAVRNDAVCARRLSATRPAGWRHRVRHQRREGCRCLHLRRGDGDLQLDRRVTGASLATSRRSRSRSACSAGRRWSTTSRR